MALRIEEVDLGAGVIHVRRGWDAKEGEIPTKSGNARRVPIPAVLRHYLDEHLLRLDGDQGLVFGVSAVSPFSPSPIGSGPLRLGAMPDLPRLDFTSAGIRSRR